MPTFATSREFAGVSPGDAYDATLKALPGLEFIIWKTRPLAWLMIANRELPGGKINANISYRPGNGAVLSISLACETMQEAELQAVGDDLAEEIARLFEGAS